MADGRQCAVGFCLIKIDIQLWPTIQLVTPSGVEPESWEKSSKPVLSDTLSAIFKMRTSLLFCFGDSYYA